MKRRIISHLQYKLPLYLAALLIPILVWLAVFSVLGEPAYNEKLSVAYFGTGCDITSLQDNVRTNISTITDNDIKEVNCNIATTSSDGIFLRLVEARTYSSDILIFSPDMWDGELLENNITPMSEEALALLKQMLPSGTEYCEIDGRVYGVILTPDGVINNYTKYNKCDGKVLAVLSSQSVNMGMLFGKGKESDDAAIELLKYLLSEAQK